MSEKFDNFCNELRTKINDADKRIKDLNAHAVGASEKAKVEAKAQLAALENKAKEQKARTAAAEKKVKSWAEGRVDAEGGATAECRSRPLVARARWSRIGDLRCALLIFAPFIGALVLTWWLGAYAVVFGFALMAVAIKLYQRQHDQPHG